MKKVKISEIGIDDSGRLYIKPLEEKFPMIYRLAKEINWDNDGHFLYSPKPREWSYLSWYNHICSTLKTDLNCHLVLSDDTIWENIDTKLRGEIELGLNDDRLIAAKLAEDYYAGKINYDKFMMDFPEDDNDPELFELFDLIEHEPPVSWIGGESQSQHDKRMERIQELIRVLKTE